MMSMTFMSLVWPWGVSAVLVLLALWLLYTSIVIVGGNEIAILERRYLGKQMPNGRVVAMSDEVGVQARTLGPGFHFLIPVLYTATKIPFVVIAEDEIGMVESIDGTSIPQGRIFARVTEGHNTFQDGEAFIGSGGEKGPQVQILPPGNYRINMALFKVNITKAVIIPPGKIGVVTSMDGHPMAAGRLLARHVDAHSNFENGQAFLSNGGQRGPQIDILLPGTYRINTDLFKVALRDATVIPASKVGLITALDGDPLPNQEFVARHIDGHADYQNASAFLEGKGQRGPQLDVLRPGTYYINPLMFDVALDDVTEIERGQVAVIVSNVGKEPTADMVASSAASNSEGGLERYVVPEGFRGIQRDVVGPGRYYVNKRAVIAYVIDTTNITIDWDNSGNTHFDPLKVISKDAFTIDVSVKVVVRVRPEQAPFMVAKVGSIDKLIQNVIHPMIDSSFRNQASSTSAMNFMQDREDEQRKAEERTRAELEKYHVECISVLICQINLPQDLMDTQTKKIIAQQQMEMYQAEGMAQEQRAATEKRRAQADMQPKLVDAEIGVQIAEQNKQKTVIAAQAEGESKRLNAAGEAAGIKAIGDAEASKILAIGKATAEAYELQNKAIGGTGVTAIEISKQIAAGNIKITPDLLVQGGDGIGGLLSTYLMQIVTQAQQKPAIPATGTAPDQTAPV
ncbi:MAG TPA: SPFH domain-containing protein [Pseudomonadales bacterium]|nr:SPFH domain-containing protein [Pseudomonadales bacterium]